jgi:hypothetical protein
MGILIHNFYGIKLQVKVLLTHNMVQYKFNTEDT